MLFKQNKTTSVTFNRFRNHVTNEVRTAKKEYYRNLVNDIKSDTKKTWAMINQLIRPNCNKNGHAIKSILFDN